MAISKWLQWKFWNIDDTKKQWAYCAVADTMDKSSSITGDMGRPWLTFSASCFLPFFLEDKDLEKGALLGYNISLSEWAFHQSLCCLVKVGAKRDDSVTSLGTLRWRSKTFIFFWTLSCTLRFYSIYSYLSHVMQFRCWLQSVKPVSMKVL